MLKYEEATMEIIPLGEDVVCASGNEFTTENGSGDGGWITWPPKQ